MFLKWYMACNYCGSLIGSH